MKQLPLWSEPPPTVAHHHIEAHYDDGYREITCTAAPRKPEHKAWQNYAGFVGGALSAEACSICNQSREVHP